MGVVAKRSSMTFYSDAMDHYSHRVRIVLSEKGVAVEVVNVESGDRPAELADLNPYNSLPTLVDRDLVLYEPNVIMEYLDERFPHPPLMPVDPVSRAKTRLALHRVEKDWYPLMHDILHKGEKTVAKSRKMLRESIGSANELFRVLPFFLSEEYSLVDATIAPL